MTKEFAKLLKADMKAMGFNQRGLGQDSGVDHSTISRLSVGNRNATAEVATKLANSLVDGFSERAEFLLFAAGHSKAEVRKSLGKKK